MRTPGFISRLDRLAVAVAATTIAAGVGTVLVSTRSDDGSTEAEVRIKAEVSGAQPGIDSAGITLADGRGETDPLARPGSPTDVDGAATGETTNADSTPPALMVGVDQNDSDRSLPSSSVTRRPGLGATGDPSPSTSTPAGNPSPSTGGPTLSSSSTTTTSPATSPTVSISTTAPTTNTTSGGTGSCARGAEFELVMRDDFGGSGVGGQWLVWNSGGNAGFGRRASSAVSVANGRLVISAGMVDGTLVSGGMNHEHAQTYGRYRFRVRTDVDPDRAMSGVVLTWPASDVHPRDGENNIYETLAHQDSATRNPFYSFIHKPFGSHSDQEYKIHRADGAKWQTMTMEWTPDRIVITREGPASSDTWTLNETSADLIPDVAHRFHIQLDAWKNSMSSTVRMEVDFAEVYRYCGG